MFFYIKKKSCYRVKNPSLSIYIILVLIVTQEMKIIKKHLETLEKLSRAELVLIASEVPHLPKETLFEFLELYEKMIEEGKALIGEGKALKEK